MSGHPDLNHYDAFGFNFGLNAQNARKDSQESSRVKILIVDDHEQNLELLDAMLTVKGYEVVRARNGIEALDVVDKAQPHIVLLDILMPGMDGYETCRRLKASEATRLIPVVLITALDRLEDRVRGIEAGGDDFITKPFQKTELMARIKSLVRMKSYLDELENAKNVLFSLAVALDFNDPYTHGHSKRVSEYGTRLAAFMGLNDAEQSIIKNGGILHDIGKIAIDKNVLHKPGAFNSSEYKHIRKHPLVGETICQPLNFAKPFLPIIRSHHEKWNGTGYPDGLVGEEIPLGSRIIGTVDVFDALITVRPYRQGMSIDTAVEILKDEARKGFWDKEIVKAFIAMVQSEANRPHEKAAM